MTSRCKYCAGLFLSNLVDLARKEFRGNTFPKTAYYQHHACFKDLEEAADSGCDLCQLILECFKGTPYTTDQSWTWPTEWQGSRCNIDVSMYADVQYFDATDVKIAINSEHVFFDEELDKVKVLDNLLVMVGIGDWEQYDPETQQHGELGLPILHLVLTTSRDNPACVDEFRIGRLEISSDLGSQENFDLARSWLHECQNSHASCISGTTPELPTRVIDVGTSKDNVVPRIFISHGKKAEYVALSHCWGGTITPLLTTETLLSFQQELPYSSLPANFKDAITITRELGIRYLWIDSLCIIQNSKEDWEQESRNMGHIYRDSTLTISASASAGSTSGILKPCVHSVDNPKPVQIRVFPDDDQKVEVRVERKDPQEEDLLNPELHCPLASRGWTLQESVLSPRHLYYGNRQIYWQCISGFKAADGAPEGAKTPYHVYGDLSSVLYAGILRNPKTELPDRELILKDYYDMVQTYCSRKLTYERDKFPALSGVAHRLQPFIGEEYLAGIWTSDFINGLLWYHEMKYCRHVKKYRAPSWSWAVTDERVLFFNEVLVPNPTELQLIDFDVILKDKSNPFGEIEDAKLTVKGFTMPVVRSLQLIEGNYIVGEIGAAYWDNPLGDEELRLNPSSICSLFSASTGDERYILSIMTKTGSYGTVEDFDIEMDKFSEEQYLALLVHADDAGEEEYSESNAQCLILRKVPGKSDDIYERAGYLARYYPRKNWLDTWELKTLTLI